MSKYDYLVVGCGMFGSVFARQAAGAGRKVLVIEKRDHIGGNCYTKKIEGINVHKYGPHIFHTSNERVWTYINRFANFNNFINRPKVRYKKRLYSFPINLMTLYQLYGVHTPDEARRKLQQVIIPNDNPENLEQWALSQVGPDIYRIFIKGYSEKQWLTSPRQLPASIIKRLPIRLTFDENYYTDKYQGIPVGGYTKIFERMLGKIEVRLNTDYFKDKEHWNSTAAKIVYTGKIDELFDYRHGTLEYIGLRLESQTLDGDYQGNAVINYTQSTVPYTRIIEHKHFEFNSSPKTVITKEFPCRCLKNDIPYYPVNTEKNNKLYQKYKRLAAKAPDLILGGRLATYKYLDMDDVILDALNLTKAIL
jgi:UDP-galactopyranose mutase